MDCRNCRTKLNQGDRCCSFCGNPVKEYEINFKNTDDKINLSDKRNKRNLSIFLGVLLIPFIIGILISIAVFIKLIMFFL